MDSNSTVDQDNILLEEVDTFLFNMPSEFALGHCVSKDMRMSAGIALNFKSTFGRIGELMDQKCSVGNVAYLKHNGRFVYYLITKERCYFKPTYDTITAAINYLRDLIVKHDVKKLAIPRIGCGLDKLHWPTVKDIIEKAFKGVECNIKVCHFTENKTKEKEIIRIIHPNVINTCTNIKDIEKREFEKLNIILYSRRTTSPAYWDKSFETVNEKYIFKSKYYEDYLVNHNVGQCLRYTTTDAYIYVIITNKRVIDHFSYHNLEKGLIKLKSMIETYQDHPTFVIQNLHNPRFEKLINSKIVSLICSTFLDLTPCVIVNITN